MRIVIVGAGFGGLSAANELRDCEDEVILIDKNNYHLFQPLLYQVAVSALSPGDIAYPVRTIFRKSKNIRVVMGEALEVNLKEKSLKLKDSETIRYDYLILAPGSLPSFFGNQKLKRYAYPLKELSDALKIREKILLSFEMAEKKLGKMDISPYLTFLIVGGGPTGVELAGAIAELVKKTILPDFPILKKQKIRVILIDSGSRILSTYPQDLSEYAERALLNLGVELVSNTKVIDIEGNRVITTNGEFLAENIFWAAGNNFPSILQTLGVNLDRLGRVIVNGDLSVPGYPEVFVIGDSAAFIDDDGNYLPAIAPVAIQEGIFVARIIKGRVPFGQRLVFSYRDKGVMATIGKARAVALLKGQKLKGLIAWLAWSLVHIFFLIGFRNKIRVMIEWVWYYITNKSGARLIVNVKKESNSS
jgi:NADH dehydrogenase